MAVLSEVTESQAKSIAKTMGKNLQSEALERTGKDLAQILTETTSTALIKSGTVKNVTDDAIERVIKDTVVKSTKEGIMNTMGSWIRKNPQKFAVGLVGTGVSAYTLSRVITGMNDGKSFEDALLDIPLDAAGHILEKGGDIALDVADRGGNVLIGGLSKLMLPGIIFIAVIIVIFLLMQMM